MSERLKKFIEKKAIPFGFAAITALSIRDVVEANSKPIDLRTQDQTIEQSTGEDPLGTDIALALTVNGAEIPVTRVPASPEILAQLAKVMDLTPDSLVNTLRWDSPDVNMGDVKLLEVSVGGTPEYVVLNPKATDASQKSKTFNTALEAKFSIFKAQINIAGGANLRTGPGVKYPATKYVAGTKEYFTGETQTEGELSWYKLASGKWVASKGLTGGKLKLIVDTNASVAETGSSTKELRVPGFDGYVVPSVWSGADPILQEFIDTNAVPTQTLSAEELKNAGTTGFTIDSDFGEPSSLTVALVGCTSADVKYGTNDWVTLCPGQWQGANGTMYMAFFTIGQGQMDMATEGSAPSSVSDKIVKQTLRKLKRGDLVEFRFLSKNIGNAPGIQEMYTTMLRKVAADTAAGVFTMPNYSEDPTIASDLRNIVHEGIPVVAYPVFKKK